MFRIIIATAMLLFFSKLAFADYAIIVDAGSSGSRLHLFYYDKTQNVPTINDLFSVSVKPGLSTFANHPENAGALLKPIFDDTVNELKKNHVDPHTVPVSVLATAGMRLLPTETQQAIYQNIQQFLSQHYSFPIAAVKTITGTMEGVYGWLDVNYLKNTFQNNQPTVGIIDMGGASTEIAFATTSAYATANFISLHIGNKDYTVFSKSFLGLGQDQAREKIQNNPLGNSCFPQGYSDGKITGNFNFANCSALYTDLIQQNHVREQVSPPNEHPAFVAYSGIFYAYDFFSAANNPEQSVIEKNIQAICTDAWEHIQQQFPAVSPVYLSTYCANGIYIADLMYGTYQLRGSQLTVTNKIGQQDIDWTLGALLFNITAH